MAYLHYFLLFVLYLLNRPLQIHQLKIYILFKLQTIFINLQCYQFAKMSFEIKFKTIINNTDNSLMWNNQIIVPKTISDKIIKSKVKRFTCDINGIVSFPCALMADGKNGFFILTNKPTIKKLKVKVGEEFNVTLTEDASEFGMPMCEELEVMLAEDPKFDAHLRGLTPGTIRSLIYLVNKYKSSDLRIRSIIVIADHLTANNGKIDNKLLYQALRNK